MTTLKEKMILLSTTSDVIQIVTGEECNLTAHASAADNGSGTITLIRKNTSITTATTTTIVDNPASGRIRTVSYINIRNNSTTNYVNTTLRHTDGTNVTVLCKEILGPGQVLEFNEFIGFKIQSSVFNVRPFDPSWHGKLHWAYGRCDPQQGLRMAQMAGTTAVTPTNLATTVARISYFRPPANITVNRIRYYGVGATTNIYQCAIYNGDTLARLTAQLTSTTAAATWGTLGSSLGLSLTVDQLYFAAVSVNATGTTAGMLCVAPTIVATTGQIAVLPKSWPGNVDIDLGYIDGGFAQFATSAGALPDPAATIATQAAWSGGFPLLLLDNDDS
jgi:hypothetical protein